jgi:hypothetical protein
VTALLQLHHLQLWQLLQQLQNQLLICTASAACINPSPPAIFPAICALLATAAATAAAVAFCCHRSAAAGLHAIFS